MDLGQIFKIEFTIMPGKSGTFVIRLGSRESGNLPEVWGFTSVADLMRFLQQHADATMNEKAVGPAFTVDAKGNRLHD
jgi:hypothetical protein